jgi:hypothetical protein
MHGSVCALCSQNQSAAALVPVEIKLPPGVGAIDFYLDLAIDCVNTTSVTMPCFVMVEPLQPDPFVTIKPVSSICASAKVGQYFGFYHHAGAVRAAQAVAGEVSCLLGCWLLRASMPCAVLCKTRCPASASADGYLGPQKRRLIECMPSMCAGGSISQIRLNCRGSYSRVIGLIRLGKQLSRGEDAVASS